MSTLWPTPATHPELADDEAHVWRIAVETISSHKQSVRHVLTASEWQRADEFLLDEPRQRFIAGRAALRVLLGRYLDLIPSTIALMVDATGKPRIAAEQNTGDLRFNVAHSGRVALIAVTRGREIGVDVERVRSVSNLEQIARRYFHPLEITAILATAPADREAAFMRCWTGKEAVLKAVGTGIADSLASFHIRIDGEAEAYVEPFSHTKDETVRCWMRRLDVDREYAAAVARVGGNARLQCMSFAL